MTRLPTRPVLAGFHPDPTVCRVGDTYYLATSSFEYAPGVPLFRSQDLRSWEQVGHVLDRPAQLLLAGATPSGGVYAPTLRHHDGLFRLVTTNLSHRFAHLVVTAPDPSGPWSDPVWVDVPGIDPDLAWDRDGTCHLTWASFGGDTFGALVQAQVDLSTGALLSAPRRLGWQGTGGKAPEAPHLYDVDGTWYLLVAEGGTERGHAATVARGPSPSGPWEPSPHNPLVTARGLDRPVQSTGHADLVQRPDGSWAAVYLGTRPGGATPGFHVRGRETFASEVLWEDGWPVLGDPVEPDAPAVGHEVLPSPPTLPLTWVSPARFPRDVLQADGDRWVLQADGEERVFVGRRQEHRHVRVRATVDASAGSGGLELRIDPFHALTVEAEAGTVRAVARVGALRSVLSEAPVPGSVVTLELRLQTPQRTVPPVRGPDQVVVGVVREDGVHELASLDRRFLSTEVATGFTGRVVGPVCGQGRLGLLSFSYVGADDEDALPQP